MRSHFSNWLFCVDLLEEKTKGVDEFYVSCSKGKLSENDLRYCVDEDVLMWS